MIYYQLSMMPGHGANPIFFTKNKIKIGRPEHSIPPLLRPITSHFYLTFPPPPTQSGRYMCINPKRLAFLLYQPGNYRLPVTLTQHLFSSHFSKQNIVFGNFTLVSFFKCSTICPPLTAVTVYLSIKFIGSISACIISPFTGPYMFYKDRCCFDTFCSRQ